MANEQSVNAFIEWIKAWDFDAIFYSVIAAFIFAFLLSWAIFFKKIKERCNNLIAKRKYIKLLHEDCSHLIVVGKRQGHSMDKAFVDLDVVKSDLMTKNGKGEIDLWDLDSTTFGTSVLVGGPGAGKSTIVKQKILNNIKRHKWGPLPFFIRLRDYVGFDKIEDALLKELAQAGFAAPEMILNQLLLQPGLCILDGLDEVKPANKKKIIEDINTFYHKYYSKKGILVVTCRREAYLDIPLDIPIILEVRPLRDDQIKEFSKKWPPGFPHGKSAQTFWQDLTATPKIQELARSPLLLVGGLMQYTESNLGVSDERYKYLERVGDWLISDWATAQGHPPDPFRSLYDRILPKLAFEMQTRNTAEIPIEDVEKLFEKWLPSYGISNSHTASDVISSLRTQTGIIISEDLHHIVFCQFGLQEYFASLEVNLKIDSENIKKLTPLSWWREPILLAVAQQKDPDAYLNSLFDLDPILAAAAVSECPTPSIEQQNRAIAVCIREADSINGAIKTPIVQLLRKVDGKEEKTLIEKLEERLTGPEKIAKFVGLIFATAGTQKTNEALSRHPEVWAVCLIDAGYLSDSFESLLFHWVKQGTEPQCFQAADALFENSNSHNFFHLLELLPELSKNKADHIAKSFLKLLLKRSKAQFRISFSGMLGIIINCVPYIKKPESFIKHYCDLEDIEFVHRARLKYTFSQTNIFHIVAICHLCSKIKSENKRYIVKTLKKLVYRSKDWCIDFPIIFCLFAAAFAQISFITSNIVYKHSCATLSSFLLLLAIAKPQPWSIFKKFKKKINRQVNYITAFLFAICCFCVICLILEPITCINLFKLFAKIAPVLIFSLGVLLLEPLKSVNVNEIEYYQPRFFRPRSYSFYSIYPKDSAIKRRYFLYCFFLILFNAVSIFIIGKINSMQISTTVSSLILVFSFYITIIVLLGHIRINRALEKSEQYLIQESLKKINKT